MSVETIVEIAALGLLGWGVYKTMPRVPERDWERLFKLLLATLIRGEVEERLLSADAGRKATANARAEWESQLVSQVPYPAEARPLDVLMSDPAMEVGEDPTAVLGPEATWDAIAGWQPAVGEGIARRLGHVVFVGLGLSAGDAMAAAVEADIVDLTELSGRVGRPPALMDRSEAGLALAEAILEQLPERSQRLVILAAGEHAFAILVALRSSEALRDRALAVVTLGGVLASEERDAWLAAQFTHERMDPELARTIAYVHVIDADTDPAAQRLVEPPLPPSGRRSIEIVDLGPLPLGGADPARLARALWVLLAFRTA